MRNFNRTFDTTYKQLVNFETLEKRKRYNQRLQLTKEADKYFLELPKNNSDYIALAHNNKNKWNLLFKWLLQYQYCYKSQKSQAQEMSLSQNQKASFLNQVQYACQQITQLSISFSILLYSNHY